MNNLPNKVDFIYDTIVDESIDVFAVTETWLQPSISNSVITIDKFAVYRNDYDSVHPKHGVSLYVRESLCVTEVNVNTPNTLRP